jgi:hypothetical protein
MRNAAELVFRGGRVLGFRGRKLVANKAAKDRLKLGVFAQDHCRPIIFPMFVYANNISYIRKIGWQPSAVKVGVGAEHVETRF